MPHVTIKHFPKDFADEQKRQLAEAITRVVTEHFGTYDGSVSIALEPVPAHDWTERVYEPEIVGRQQSLIKEPNYRNN